MAWIWFNHGGEGAPVDEPAFAIGRDLAGERLEAREIDLRIVRLGEGRGGGHSDQRGEQQGESGAAHGGLLCSRLATPPKLSRL